MSHAVAARMMMSFGALSWGVHALPSAVSRALGPIVLSRFPWEFPERALFRGSKDDGQSVNDTFSAEWVTAVLLIASFAHAK